MIVRLGVAAATGALGARGALIALRRRPPGGPAPWTRVNHAGHPVSLLEGPALVIGALLGCVASVSGPGPDERHASTATAVAALAAGALGAVDDLRGDSASKGLAGHLGALRRGRVTTGVVKIGGLALTGVVAAALVDRGRHPAPGAVSTLVGAGVVAGSANLANLLDLRPGRALKVGLVTATALQPCAPAAAVAGSAAALIGPDLAARTMLGDTGANSLGAALGVALLGRLGRPGRCVALAVLSGLTLASERVSFTSVIESTPVLRELDALGR